MLEIEGLLQTFFRNLNHKKNPKPQMLEIEELLQTFFRNLNHKKYISSPRYQQIC